MKTNILIITMLFATNLLFANTIIVDINGAGQYTTIQSAINAAETGDTVQVWPGTYVEQVNLNKAILLCGSGYENTIITGNYNPSVWISNGKIKWFTITSLQGNGINMKGGSAVVANCIIKSCVDHGIVSDQIDQFNGSIYNCVLISNAAEGVHAITGSLIAINCISRSNGGTGFYGYYANRVNVSYSNGSISSVANGIGCIDIDPNFVSTANNDYHVTSGSPCNNTGNPSLTDPDGTRSDMGYFGGPDAPTYPVVYEMTIAPNGSTINVQAKARANY